MKNLPPHQRPIPDVSAQKADWTLLPQPIRSLASQIKALDDEPMLACGRGDDYYFRWDGAYRELLQILRRHLHPFLAKHGRGFGVRFEAAVRGHVRIRFHTKCSTKEYIALSDDNLPNDDRDIYLTQPPPTDISIFGLKGVEWDLLYADVQSRDNGGGQDLGVRIQRERGVRMGDVLDELRGVLIPDMGPNADGDILIEWHFDEPVQ